MRCSAAADLTRPSIPEQALAYLFVQRSDLWAEPRHPDFGAERYAGRAGDIAVRQYGFSAALA